MRVAIIETRGEKFAVNKDQAGSFGTATDVGTGLFANLLNKIKRKGVRTPTMFLAYVHSIFELECHEVKFYDKIPNEQFDIAIIASSIVDYKNELKVAQEIKKQYSKTKIGFIGAFATVNPTLFLQNGDFVITGEPEDASLKIARNEIEPKGIVQSDLIKDLDSLPFPQWHGRNISEYSYYPLLKKKPFITVLSSRGCPYDCSYCPYMVIQTPLWRKRSPKNVVDEIEYLIQEYGIKSITFRDPMFTMDMDRTKKICQEIIKRKLDFEWDCETRVDRLDESLIDIMKKAGLTSIEFGVESFDLNLLSSMNRKPPTHEQQEKIVEYCENSGIKMMAFYVLGIPGQTRKDIIKTIDYAKYLNTSLAQFTIATPYPGTKFGSDVKNEIINEDWQNYNSYTPLIQLKDLTSEEILNLKEKAFKDYYLRGKWIFKRGFGIVA